MIKKAKVISIGTLKGGNGKTMTAVSTSSILAERGNKVLIIDIDPQANATSNLGINEIENGIPTVQEIYENKNCDAQSIILRSPIKKLPSMDIIPGSILLTATEIKINSQAGREFILRNFFKRNSEVLNSYDYIVFDTNPYMTIVNQNAFVISDAIILTTRCGMNDLKGIELFQGLWENIRELLDIEDNIKGVLMTAYDQRVKLQREFVEYIQTREDFKNLLFNTIIPINARLPETEVEYTPINLYDKESKGYQAYANFVDELIQRI